MMSTTANEGKRYEKPRERSRVIEIRIADAFLFFLSFFFVGTWSKIVECAIEK